MVPGQERVCFYGLSRQYLKHVLLLWDLLHPMGVQKRRVLVLPFYHEGLLIRLNCYY